MANKSIYCEEIEDFIAQHVSMGMSKTLVAQALGVKPQILYKWIERKKSLVRKIAEYRLTEARRRISGVGDQWWLERVMPDEFGDNKQNQTVSLTVQMLVDARSALEAAGGLDDCQIIDAEATETRLIECKTGSAAGEEKEGE